MPIGFFDSGVGGLSVMKKAIEIMPNEDYIYFGDSKNAPYGVKSVKEVRDLTFNAVEFLLSKGVKGIAVACNTATSAAVAELRVAYPNLPLVGIEPALKPAVELNKSGTILIMATPMTLRENKFSALMERYREKSKIIPVPCEGLVEFIEKGILDSEELQQYLFKKVNTYKEEDIGAIVLGCTHYPFIKKALIKAVGENVEILDGSLGTVKELRRRLLEKNMLTDREDCGKIEIYNSAQNEELIQLSMALIELL